MTSKDLRWIEKLPEVGQPILDRLKWIWEGEMLLAEKRRDLLDDVKRQWTRSEIQRNPEA